jgi:hypothetical protein
MELKSAPSPPTQKNDQGKVFTAEKKKNNSD